MGIPTYADTTPHKLRKRKKLGLCKWSRDTVYRILTNETYAGTWHYGKYVRRNGQRVRNPIDNLIPVTVQETVDREIWEAAQSRLKYNRRTAKRNRKYNYLLSGHVTCGSCGLKMAGTSRKTQERLYLYYRCPATRGGRVPSIARHCKVPLFRADHVGAVIWDWIRGKLLDPARLEKGLSDYKAECDQENTPLRERSAVVEDLIADNKTQLERVLDLYISGDFPKEMLTERKAHLETTIKSLEKEQANLIASLRARTLTREQIQTIQEFAAEIADRLEIADTCPEVQRQLIEMLDVQATLTVENGEKVVYVSCVLDDARFALGLIPEIGILQI